MGGTVFRVLVLIVHSHCLLHSVLVYRLSLSQEQTHFLLSIICQPISALVSPALGQDDSESSRKFREFTTDLKLFQLNKLLLKALGYLHDAFSGTSMPPDFSPNPLQNPKCSQLLFGKLKFQLILRTYGAFTSRFYGSDERTINSNSRKFRLQ